MSTKVGPVYPTNGASEGMTDAWIFPENITADDENYAAGQALEGDSAYLVGTGFDFSSIPDNAQIVGIQIEYKGQWFSFI